MDKRAILLPSLDEGFKVNFLRRLYIPELNLISNPGFETAGLGDPDFWASWTETKGDGALANETTLVYEGVDAVKVTTGPSVNTYIWQAYNSIIAGKKYLFRFRTRGDDTNAGRYSIYDVTNASNIFAVASTDVLGTTYTPIVKEFKAPASCTSIRFYLYGAPTNGGIVYFDICELYLLN